MQIYILVSKMHRTILQKKKEHLQNDVERCQWFNGREIPIGKSRLREQTVLTKELRGMRLGRSLKM